MPAKNNTNDQRSDLGASDLRAATIAKYFLENSPWSMLPADVTHSLASKLAIKEESLFQELLKECAANDLVDKHFIPIGKDLKDTDLSLMLMAQTLYNYGSMYSKGLMTNKNMSETETDKICNHAVSLFRCALAIEPRYFPAIFGLGVVYGTRLEIAKAMDYCDRALKDIEYILSTPNEKLSVFENTARDVEMDLVRSQITEYMNKLRSLF